MLRFLWVTAFVLTLTASLASLALSYPDASDTRRWQSGVAGDPHEIDFNLSPTWFPTNGSRWQQVVDGVFSWNRFGFPDNSIRGVKGSALSIYYYFPALNVEANDHGDSISTIGFDPNFGDTRTLAVTDWFTFPSSTTYREADISVDLLPLLPPHQDANSCSLS